jgi:hypothetical protein
MRLGKAVAENNGYFIHELFVLDEDGKYVFVGYGVLSPDGKLLQSFSTLEAAQNYLDEVASTPTSSLKP